MQFRVLGPLEVDAGDGPLPLGGPKQRMVLAGLLVRANEVVPADTLIVEIWGDDPPEKARNTLQTYVSNLRRTLGGGRIRGRSPGYVLFVDPPELDASRFDALVREGKHAIATDPAAAVDRFDEALALWRGPALADLADHPSLLPEIVRLDQLRVEARAERIEALLATGASGRAVGELEALVGRDPLRERLWSLLMLALYREGRQAEALGAFQRARELLANELGVDPSNELVRLQRRILDHDPTLELLGERVRGYRLLEPIGEGSVGVVYRGIQPYVGREVAIKSIDPSFANDPAFVRRFEAEAQTVGRLEHPHIVPLYDSWRDPLGAYLVTPYMSAGSFRRKLEDGGALDLRDVSRLLGQLADALATAHRQGVVHGYLKPENVLLDADGNAYVSDFGIARPTADPASARLLGSRAYLAPEQIRGERVTPQSDVYALGIVIFEALARDHPFAGRSVATMLEGILHEPIPSVSMSRADVPSSIDEVIAKATAKEPALRYASPLTLAAAFDRAIGAGRDAPPPIGDVPNPYKGLRPFGEADAVDFFGREAFVDRLVARIEDADDRRRLLVVVGPSGSGKSSVVRAGLIPTLRADASARSADRFFVEMAPGRHPLEELEAALLRVAVTQPPSLDEMLAGADGDLSSFLDAVLPNRHAELVLVVDQLEEAFTLVEDEQERLRFLDLLGAAVTDPRLIVVATLRADFYDRPLAHPGFGELIAARTEALAGLTPDELEQAIRGPAERLGVRPEPGLVAEVIADLAHQPGALPLAEYALTELFEQRDHDGLTLHAYREIGGIAGALSSRAESIYAHAGPEGRRVVRQLLMRLVTLGEGREDTRRRVTRTELDGLGVDPALLASTLETLGRHRLLTFDRDPTTREPTVEIAHEALLRAWPRLREWIDTGREDLRQERRLALSAAEWKASGNDPSFLLRGARLEQAEKWASSSGGLAIGRPDLAYLKASVDLRERELAVDRAREERERRLERRSVRRLRGLVAVFAVAALVAASLSVVATNQSGRAERQSRIAFARELAAAAVASIDEDPERAVLLAIEAVRRTGSGAGTALPEAVDALHRAIAASRILFSINELGGAVAWGPNGTFAAERAGDPGVIEIRDGETAAPVRSITTGTSNVTELAFTPDGSMLGSTSGRRLRIWDSRTGRSIADVTGRGAVHGLSFSADGSLVSATWPAEGIVRVLKTSRGTVARELRITASDVALAPDGTEMALTHGGVTQVLEIPSGEPAFHPLIASSISDTNYGVSDVSWSPNGRVIATIGLGGLDLWNAGSGTLRSFQATAWGDGLSWSSDPSLLVTGGRTVRLWPIESSGNVGQPPNLTIPSAAGGETADVSVSPDGERVIASGVLGTVTIWDAGVGGDAEWAHLAADPYFGSVRFLPNGTFVAADEDGRMTTWDPRTGEVLRTFGPPVQEYIFETSPEGLLALPNGSTTELWDPVTGDRRSDLPAVPEAWSPSGTRFVAGETVFDLVGQPITVLRDPETPEVSGRAWSADGRWVLTAFDGPSAGIGLWDPVGGDLRRTLDTGTGSESIFMATHDHRLLIAGGEMRPAIWDLENDRLIAELAAHPDSCGVAFSPDGRTVAIGDGDFSVRLFDASTGRQLLVLRGHDRTVCSVSFSPDGTMLASQSPAEIRVWALDIDDLVAIGRDNVTRTLTDAECRRYLHATTCAGV